MPGASEAKNSARKITSAAEFFFAMSVMAKLTLGLTPNDPHNDA